MRPNILFILADQMAGPALPFHGNAIVKAPRLSALAADGVVFDSAYCNSPLCAPSRFSLMAGQLPSRIGAFDNAAEFPAAVPTFAHYLRALGYRTCLSGKMHFVGPDQLHGFEERLTTDIYPSDFGWTPDWEGPEQRFSWYHNMLSVVQAGVCTTTNQLDYDEEVAFHAVRRILEMARDGDGAHFAWWCRSPIRTTRTRSRANTGTGTTTPKSTFRLLPQYLRTNSIHTAAACARCVPWTSTR